MDKVALFLLVAAAFIAGYIISGIVLFNSAMMLSFAQAAYTRCITDGAPPDNCAKTYLLPKEDTQ